jgi:tRNA/rRNA methyltransferase
MLFKNIHFILVRPQLGENIGAAARSLKNFNFENLRLVSPRDSWPNKSATYTAVDAKDIVHKAKVFSNNNQAVSDLDYVFATTSRSRSVNKKIIDLNEAVKIIKKHLLEFAKCFSSPTLQYKQKDLTDLANLLD